MTLIHKNEILKYGEVTTALLNHELRHCDKESAKMNLVEALALQQGRSENKQKGDNKRGKSCGRYLGKNQCAFCLENGHWKKDCPKLKEKKNEVSIEANFSMEEHDEDSDVSLFVVSKSLYLDDSY